MRAWRVGTAFGIGLYVHWTFLLLLAFVLYKNWDADHLGAAVYAGAILVAVFGCVILHELGHALTARLFGIPTRDITLYPIGGVARLERMSENPWEEFWIAVAGPAVNVVIAVCLLMLQLLALGNSSGFPTTLLEARAGNFLFDLTIINITLVVFNLLPAFPMDGGRVLRALLAVWMGRLPATTVAAILGAVFAFLFVFFGFKVSHPMLILVGAFVFLAGQQELALVRYREARRNFRPLTVLPVEEEVHDVIPVTSPPELTVATWDSENQVWVLWHNGRPVKTYGLN